MIGHKAGLSRRQGCGRAAGLGCRWHGQIVAAHGGAGGSFRAGSRADNKHYVKSAFVLAATSRRIPRLTGGLPSRAGAGGGYY